MAEGPISVEDRGSGVRDKQPEPRYLAVGRIVRPHGIRGELRMEILTEYPERLGELSVVYLGPDYRKYALESVRLHQKVALVKMRGCEERDAAEALRGQLVYVALEDAIPLEQNEYYEYQVEGLDVVTDDGQYLGEVVEVLAVPGANDVLVIYGPFGEVLIPVIEDVVVHVDVEVGRVTIHPLPGLLPAS